MSCVKTSKGQHCWFAVQVGLLIACRICHHSVNAANVSDNGRTSDPLEERAHCGVARNSLDALYFVPDFIMAPVDFNGKWKLDRSENFEDYLKVLSVPYLGRKIASTFRPVHEISQDGDTLMIKTHGPRGNQEVTFTVGEDFEMTILATGGKYKCVAKWEGSVLVVECEPLDEKHKHQTDTREIVDGEMILTLEIGGVKCKRIFKKQ